MSHRPGTSKTVNAVMSRSFSSLNTQDDVAISDSQLGNLSSLSNEELADTSTIPGWDLVHTPPTGISERRLVGQGGFR